MLFNSIDFALFLPVVFLIYWAIGPQRVRWQNSFLILAGSVFYGWWDWRFLGLLLFTSGVDYLVALGLEAGGSPGRRKCSWERAWWPTLACSGSSSTTISS